jgi:hypothetical protein
MNSTPQDNDPTFALMSYASQAIQVESKVTLNIGQEIIITTEDKIRLCLLDHLSKLEKKKGWHTPLGIFITISIALFSTTFKDFLFLPAETWQAMFILSAGICFCWLIWAFFRARVSTSLSNIVENIKESGYKYKE